MGSAQIGAAEIGVAQVNASVILEAAILSLLVEQAEARPGPMQHCLPIWRISSTPFPKQMAQRRARLAGSSLAALVSLENIVKSTRLTATKRPTSRLGKKAM